MVVSLHPVPQALDERILARRRFTIVNIHLSGSGYVKFECAFAQYIVQMQNALDLLPGIDDRKNRNLVLFHEIQGIIGRGIFRYVPWIFGHDLFYGAL
jgi:hypothetical protein